MSCGCAVNTSHETSGCPPAASCDGLRGGWWRRSHGRAIPVLCYLGSWDSAFVAAVARMEWTQVPIASALTPDSVAYFTNDISVHRAGIERTTNRPGAVVHHRPEARAVQIEHYTAARCNLDIFANEAQHYRMAGMKDQVGYKLGTVSFMIRHSQWFGE
jgi:hypothetical protein